MIISPKNPVDPSQSNRFSFRVKKSHPKRSSEWISGFLVPSPFTKLVFFLEGQVVGEKIGKCG